MFKIFRTRLQNKLVVAFILVLLIPTVVIVGYSLTTTRSILLDKARPDKLKAIEGQVANIQGRLLRIKDDLLLLSQGKAVKSYIQDISQSSDPASVNSAPVSLYLQSFIGHATDTYLDARILDVTGQEIVGAANVNGRPQNIIASDLESQADQPYFIRTIGLIPGEIFISRADLNAAQGKTLMPYVPIIRYAIPLYNDTETISGVLVLKALLKPVLAAGVESDPSVTTYVVDSDGSYLLNPDQSRLYGRVVGQKSGLAADLPDDSTAILGSSEGALFGSKDLPDALQVFAHVTLPGYDTIQWTLVQQQPLANILKEVNNTYLVIFSLAGLALLVAIGVGIAVTHSILRPVQELTHTAMAIAGGDLSQQVSPHSEDEIGELARTFNKMSQEVSTSHNTLEKRVEERTEQLREANRRTEEISRAKSIFLSNMSHELRTPLNVIIGYSSSMLDMPELYDNRTLDSDHERDVRLIKDSAYYLLGLITDILDLSKIEAGKLELHRSAVDLPELFKGILAISVGLVKDKPIQVRPDFSSDLPPVWADPTRVRQIMLNLMSNAIKFTQTGSVTLRARVENQVVHISVIDTGVGIEEKVLPYVFDRFEQGGRDIDKYYGGTGLGLDIAKQLAQMHGGDLTVQSQLGQGSIFTFGLPLADSQQLKQTPAEIQPTTTEEIASTVQILMPSQSIAPQSILLVEDEESMRSLMRRVLEEAGYVVVDAQDGEQAMKMAYGLLPDLIILDVRLPN
ncbi:MAG TPA: ATP-binding protein, partial [Aggregatilineales bacterium]|nr:ATP-binding protein [Aggregatilineales bacterium]